MRLPVVPNAEFTVGYFTEPDQTEPAYDPGLNLPCPICHRMLTEAPVLTISLVSLNGPSCWSYFYRVHRACHNQLTNRQRQELDDFVLMLVEG